MGDQDLKKTENQMEGTETLDITEESSRIETDSMQGQAAVETGKKKSFKAGKTEIIAGLVLGAMLVFGAGFGCGTMAAGNQGKQFRQEAVAGQRPGMGQDSPEGPGGQEFGQGNDGFQGPQGRGGRGHGRHNWGGPGSQDSQQGETNPPAANGPEDSNGGQPGQDSTTQSKDSTSQSKDSTTQSKDSTDSSEGTTQQNNNSASLQSL